MTRCIDCGGEIVEGQDHHCHTRSVPEGEYRFYKADRERIKGRSMLPTDTLRYIESLEALAKVAYEAWNNTPLANMPTDLTIACMNDLYNALAVVNFMDDDL